MKKNLSKLILLFLIAVFIVCCCINSPISQATGSLWSLLPPIIAIGLALVTKEVYSSLFAGIVTGGIIYSITSSTGFSGMSATTMKLLPAILFIVAAGLSFATGTSWGTFGILIPIVTSVFSTDLATASETGIVPVSVVICISACLAGAVCGDHCSPISDTTIMASAGAQCDHVNHVSTQLPYSLTVASVSVVGYIISGFVQNVFIVLGCSLLMMIATLFILKIILSPQKSL